LRTFDYGWFAGAIFDGRIAAKNSRLRKNRVVKLNEEFAFDVLECDGEAAAFDFMADIVEDEVAIAIGERNLQAGLDVKASAPAGIFLRGACGAEVEGSPFGRAVRGGEICVPRDVFAPIDMLKNVLLVDAEDVGDFAVVEEKELWLFEEADRRLRRGDGSEGKDDQHGEKGSTIETVAKIHGDGSLSGICGWDGVPERFQGEKPTMETFTFPCASWTDLADESTSTSPQRVAGTRRPA
jgi:hypothetical protein